MIKKENKIIAKRAKKSKPKTISYKLKFIDRARFTASLLSKPAGNLAEGTTKNKSKYEDDNKKCRKI